MTDAPSDDAPSPVSAPELRTPDLPSASLDGGPDGADPAAASQVGVTEGLSTKKLSPATRSVVEWVAVIVGALVVALVVKTFLVQAFYIPSESMVPTLEVGDRVLVNKLAYQWSDIDRGDVIVFDRPGGAGPDGIEELIKRVVALPGETVEGRDNQIYIDGDPLEEDYLPEGTFTTDFGPETIAEDQLWVMGDNRTRSEDSRVFRSIPVDTVVGRAFAIIWPLGEAGGL